MFKTLILIIHHFVFAVTLYYDNIPLHICIVFLETMVLFINMVPNAIKIFSVIHLFVIIYYFYQLRINNNIVVIFS